MNRMLWIKLERIIMREKIFKWKKKTKIKNKKKKTEKWYMSTHKIAYHLFNDLDEK